MKGVEGVFWVLLRHTPGSTGSHGVFDTVVVHAAGSGLAAGVAQCSPALQIWLLISVLCFPDRFS